MDEKRRMATRLCNWADTETVRRSWPLACFTTPSREMITATAVSHLFSKPSLALACVIACIWTTLPQCLRKKAWTSGRKENEILETGTNQIKKAEPSDTRAGLGTERYVAH